MTTPSNDTMQFLRDLGSVDTLTQAATQEAGLQNRPVYNSHVHFPPNFSAFDTVDQAVTMAAEQGVGVLGTGNYYDYSIYQEFIKLARGKDIFPLFGTEVIALDRDLMQQGIRINDPGNPGKIYICGKGISGFASLNETAKHWLRLIRRSDTRRMALMTKKMADVFSSGGVDTGLTDQAIIDRTAARHQCNRDTIILQERHLCQAFQERLFEIVEPNQRLSTLSTILGIQPTSKADDTVGLQNEIRSHLIKAGKPCFVPEDFVDLSQACALIHALGGIVCYPVLADGANPRCEYEVAPEPLVNRLKAQRIGLVELITIRNEVDVVVEYVTHLRKAGIAVVAGTEHNTLDLIPLAPTCKGGVPIPEPIREIFWEGICVIAAHQFLTAHGRCGFVDTQGEFNPAYFSHEVRMTAFKKLGAAVIDAYNAKRSS